MTSRKKRRGDGSARPEHEPAWLHDDVDEDQMFGGRVPADTKTIQLCRQVEEAISCALAGATSPLLRDLYVVSVEPIRGAALLRVLVAMEGDPHDCQQTLGALARAASYFRHEVARDIHRKRVPALQFAIVPGTSDGLEPEVPRD